MNYTTIEQSKKILELGLSRDTADMVYKYNFLLESNDTTPKVVNGNLHDTTLKNIPCWSLGALLDVMPRYIQINSKHIGLTIDITFVHNGIVTDSHHIKNNTFLEAAFNMVVWLLKNNYIKKGE